MLPLWKPLASLAWLSTLVVNPVYAAKGAALQDDAVDNGNSTSNSVGVSWIFPSSSSTSTFDSTDTIDVQWSSNYGNTNLKLLCKGANAKQYFQKSNNNVAQTGSQVTRLNVIQNGDFGTCHFVLVDLANTGSTSNSTTFTIKNAPNAAPHTWSASSLPTSISSSSLPTSTSSIASVDVAAPTPTPTTAPEPAYSTTSSSPPSSAASNDTSSNDRSGLSTGAGAGIGVGVAAAVVALAVGGLLLFLFARQRKARRLEGMPDGKDPKGMIDRRPTRIIPGIHETIGNRPAPQELDASNTPASPDQGSARSEVDRNEEAGHWSLQLDTADRRQSEGSDRSSTPASMRRDPMEAVEGPI